MAELTTSQADAVVRAAELLNSFLNGTPPDGINSQAEAFNAAQAILAAAGLPADQAQQTLQQFNSLISQNAFDPAAALNAARSLAASGVFGNLPGNASQPGLGQNNLFNADTTVAASGTGTGDIFSGPISPFAAGNNAGSSGPGFANPFNSTIRPELTGLTLNNRPSLTNPAPAPERTALTGDSTGAGSLPPGTPVELASLTADGASGLLSGNTSGIGNGLGNLGTGGVGGGNIGVFNNFINNANLIPSFTPTPPAPPASNTPPTATVNISAVQSSVLEGPAGATTTLSFTVSRSVAVRDGQVSWAVSGVSADYFGGSLPGGVVQFSAGQLTATVQVTLNGNYQINGDQTLGVTLSNPSTNHVLGTAQAQTRIIDDDGTVSISPSASAVLEGDAGQTRDVTFTITRSTPHGTGSVNWAASGLDAADFGGTVPSGTVTFANGEQSKTITISIAGDRTVEPDETLTVTLSNPSASLTLGQASANTIITNDDGWVSIQSQQAAVLEGDTGSVKTLKFTVTRSNDSGESTVDWAVSGINAADLVDGSALSGTLSFPAGTDTQEIVLQLRGDRDIEPDETATVTLTNAQGNMRIDTATASTVITNDDFGVSLSGVTTDVIEGATGTTTNVTFTVTRSAEMMGESGVDWRFVRVGTHAADASDFANDQNGLSLSDGMPSGRVFFNDGEYTKTITVQVQGDNIAENDETFGIVLFNATNSAQIINGEAYGTIRTDESVYSIQAVTASTAEGNGADGIQEFIISRTGNTSAAGSIDFVIEGQGELPADAADFASSQLLNGTINFAAGESSKTVQVRLNGDTTIEGSETWSMRLVPGSANTQVDVGIAVVAINNDDQSVSIAATNAVVREGNGTATPLVFTLTRTGELSIPATVEWQVVGRTGRPVDAADFGGTLPSGVVQFVAGQATATITFSPTPDSTFEFDEGLQVVITSSTPGLTIKQNSADGVIRNDDVSLTVDAAALTGPEGDANAPRSITLRVERAGDLGHNTTVDWALLFEGNNPASAADFVDGTAFSGSISFGPGETSKAVTLQLVPNSLLEADKDFRVVLSNANAGAQIVSASTSGKITNDDVVFNLVDAPDVLETHGARTITYTVQRTGDLTGEDLIGWSLTPGATQGVDAADFAGGVLPSGTLVFYGGEDTAYITFTIAGDSAFEPDENFVITLGAPNNGATVSNGSVTGQILNDDSVFSVVANAGTVIEGNGTDTPVSFTITRSGYLGGESDVHWRIVGTGENPVNGEDFAGGALPGGVVTFAENEGSQTVTINVRADTLMENNETLRLELYDPSTGSTIGTGTADVVVQNDDTGLRIALTSSNLAEGDSGEVVHQFTVTRSGVLTGTTTVDWTLYAQSLGLDADDFVAGQNGLNNASGLPSGTITFAPDETSKVIEVRTRGDVSIEDTEAFYVELSNASNSADIQTGTASGGITADDIGFAIAAEQASVNEGDANTTQVLRFTVTRSGDTASAATIHWAATGLQPDDFIDGTILANDLVFNANETTKTLEFTLKGDVTVEDTETLTITLTNPDSNPAKAQTHISQATATTVVTNDDTGLSLGTTPVSQHEGQTGATSYTFTITRTGELTAGSIDWQVSLPGSGAAASLADFTAGQDALGNNNGLPSGSVTFTEGQNTAVITVQVAGDGSIELDELFTVNLVNPPANTQLVHGSVNGVIVNDDLGFSITALDAVKTEGQSGLTAFTFTVTRAGNLDSAATVDWSIPVGGSLAGDFYVTSGTVSFGEDVASQTVTVYVNGDTVVEDDEIFDVVLSNAQLTGGTPVDIIDGTAQGIIKNDDQSFAVSAPATLVEGNSGSQTVTFTVTRSGDTSAAATVAYEVTGGAGLDLNDLINGLPASTLSFAAGQTEQTVTITVKGDTVVEDNETVTLTLTNPSAGIIAQGAGSATTTITNDDTNYAISAPVAAFEGTTGAYTEFTFTVTRSGVTTAPSTVNWAVDTSVASSLSNGDFYGTQPSGVTLVGGIPQGTVSFGAGEGSKTIVVRVNGDTAVESAENLRINLSSPSVGTIEAGEGSATVQVLNDDAVFSITADVATTAEGNTGDKAVTFTVTRSGYIDDARSLTWTFTGSGGIDATDLNDWQATTGTVSFAAGDSTAQITIWLKGDSNVETDGNITVTLSNPPANSTIGTASASTTITNDDATFSIAAQSASVGEGNTGYIPVTFTISRSSFTNQTNTIEWRLDTAVSDAVNAADFYGVQPSGVLLNNGIPYGSLTFSPTEASKTVTLWVASDSALEVHENLRVVIENPSAGSELGTASATTQITNDDAELNITAGPASVAEGDGGHGTGAAFTYTITRTGNLNQASTVNWTVVHGNTSSTDFTNGTNGYGNTNGTVTFAPGDAQQTFTVYAYGDTGLGSVENNENFSVVLSNASAGTSIGSAGSYNSTINNDDTEVLINWTQARQAEKIAGESTTYEITLTRSGDTSKISTVNWNVSGLGSVWDGSTWDTAADASDFGGAFPSGTVQFASGQTSKTITITVPGDNTVEGDEWFRVNFTNAGGIDYLKTTNNGASGTDQWFSSTDTGTLTLIGEIKRDEAIFDITDAPTTGRSRLEGDTIIDGGSGEYVEHTFAVHRTISSAGEAWVEWKLSNGAAGYTATNIDDFVAGQDALGTNGGLPSGRLLFGDGETVKYITVHTRTDDIGEWDEAFRVYLSTVSAGSSIAVNDDNSYSLNNYVVIQNDDTRFDASSGRVAEGENLTFTITRSGDTRGSDSVDWQIVLPGEEAGNEGNNITSTWYKLDVADLDMAWIQAHNPDANLIWDAGTRTLSGTFTFLNGESNKTLILKTIDDNLTETWREDVTLTLSNPQNLVDDPNVDLETVTIGGGSAVGGVTDNEPDPIVSVEASTTTIFEGSSGTKTFTYTLTRTDVDGNGTVDYPTTVVWELSGNYINWGGTGGAHISDISGAGVTSSEVAYNLTRGTAYFAAGEFSKTITITLNSDLVVESDTNITFRVLPANEGYSYDGDNTQSGYGPGNADPDTPDNTATVVLRNDDVRLTIGSYYSTLPNSENPISAYEGKPLTFTIARYGRLDNEITLTYSLINGTTSGVDFSSTTGTITLAANQSSTTVSLTDLLLKDGITENTENFTIRLTAPSDIEGSTVRFNQDPSTASGNMTVDIAAQLKDTNTSYTLTPSLLSQNESGQGQSATYAVTVARTGYADRATVYWRVEGTGANPADADDFPGGVFPSGTIYFAAGDNSEALTFNIRGDGAVEQNENFRVVLYKEVLHDPGETRDISVNSATLTAVNDDTGISIADATITETDGNQTLSFEVTRSGVTTGTSTMNWTLLNGTTDMNDFVGATSGTLSFGANETKKTISITVAGDVTPEQLETFRIELSEFSSDVTDKIDISATGTIYNDDSSFSIAADNSSTTESGSRTFTITRTHDTVQSQTINWSLVFDGTANASDFTGQTTSGSVTFAPGELSKTITVTPNNDNTAEADETYSVKITLGTGTTGDTITTDTATGVIVNDDAAFAISAGQSDKAEDSANPTAFTFTVTRTGDTSGSGSVNWKLSSALGAVNATDFNSVDGQTPLDALSNNNGLPSGTVSFAANETSKTITIYVNGDSTQEADEPFSVTLESPSGGQILTGSGTASSTIVNDDSTISIAAASADKAEGNNGTTPFTFTVTRSGDLTSVKTVKWAITGSGLHAADAADFGGLFPSGTLTLPAGQASITLTVDVSGDLLGESDEGFTVTLSDPTSGVTIDQATANGTIRADDVVFNVAAPVQPALDEGGTGTTEFVFIVTRTGNLSGAQTLNWSVAGVGDHPANADDFAATTGTVTFIAGQQTAEVRVQVNGDYQAESNEGFRLTLAGPDNLVFETATADATIVNDDVALAIVATDARHIEGHDGIETVYTFTVTRTGNLALDSTVDWAFDPGALNDNDLKAGQTLSGQLSFTNGAASQTITITVLGDRDIEPDESFSINLSNASTGSQIVTGSATGTVVSDDVEWTLTPASTPVEGDNGGTAYTFTVTRTGGQGPTSLNWTVAPQGDHPADADDFAAGAFPFGSVSFAQGQMTQTITVWVAGDNVLEADQGFTVNISVPEDADDGLHHTFTNASVDAVIANDDDIMAIAATASDGAEGSGTAGELTFTVTRTGSLTGTSTVDWRIVHGTTNADDFVANTGTVTFTDGEHTKVITVRPAGDRTVELDEDFSVELYNPGAGSTLNPDATTATGIIRNDDVDLTVAAVVATVIEGDNATAGRLHYTVTRTGDLSGETTVDWAVIAGSATATDFAGNALPSGQLTFAANETVKDIYIDLNGDGSYEGNENFTLQLSNATANADVVNNNATGTITDDDDVLKLVAVVADQPEGDVGTTQFTFRIDRVGSATGEASVQWNAAGSGSHALSADELVNATGTVTFADGETFKEITVEVRSDVLGEYDEGFQVWLSNPSFGSTIDTSTNSGRVDAVVRNDDPVLFIRADHPSGIAEGSAGINEEGTPYTFTVTRSGNISVTSSVRWEVIPTGAVAANAEDFGGFYPSGVVAFGVGESSKTITVYITQDGDGERDETFSVQLSDAQGATILEGQAETVIQNDDTGLVITPLGNVDKHEGNDGQTTEYTFRVERVGDASSAASVQWRVEGTGTYPANAGDFVGGAYPGSTLTFAAGETYKDIVVQVAGDSTLGADQTFDVVLYNPVDITIITPTASGTILNDDSQFSVVAVDSALDEGSNGVTTVFRFTITRSGATDLPADISWSVGGTGAEPANAADFVGGVLPGGTLSFAANETSKTIEIEVYGDDIGEANEQFTVTLNATAPGTVVNPLQGSARATIVGDDVDLTIIALDSQRPEGQPGDNNALSYRILRAGPDNQAITINYAISGAVNANDFGIPLTGTITLAAGVSEMLFSLPIQGDTEREGNEAFNITFTHPALAGGNSVISGVIVDDDLGLALTGPANVTEGAAATTQVLTYTLTRNPSDQSETFYWKALSGANQGADGDDLAGGTLPSGVLTFAPNATEVTFNITVQGDNWVEANESLNIVVTRTADATTALVSTTTTLVNDDVASNGDDILHGTASDDTLQGLGGNDQLFGGKGSDALLGGAGDDVLTGGMGADILTGGAGADRFHYESPAEGMDSILDFEAGVDAITFNPGNFGGLTSLSSISQSYDTDVLTTLNQLAAQADADVYRISFAPGQFRFGTGDNGELDELEAAITGGNHTGAAFFLISDGDVTRLYYDADTAAGTDGSQMVALAEMANQPVAHTLPEDTIQPQST